MFREILPILFGGSCAHNGRVASKWLRDKNVWSPSRRLRAPGAIAGEQRDAG